MRRQTKPCLINYTMDFRLQLQGMDTGQFANFQTSPVELEVLTEDDTHRLLPVPMLTEFEMVC